MFNILLREENIGIAAVIETRKKLKGTKDCEDYLILYSGVDRDQRAKAGVALLKDIGNG